MPSVAEVSAWVALCPHLICFDRLVPMTGVKFILDPSNPPAGFTFSADGTKITVAASSTPAAWIGVSDALVSIQSVAGLQAISGPVLIQTQE